MYRTICVLVFLSYTFACTQVFVQNNGETVGSVYAVRAISGVPHVAYVRQLYTEDGSTLQGSRLMIKNIANNSQNELSNHVECTCEVHLQVDFSNFQWMQSSVTCFASLQWPTCTLCTGGAVYTISTFCVNGDVFGFKLGVLKLFTNSTTFAFVTSSVRGRTFAYKAGPLGENPIGLYYADIAPMDTSATPVLLRAGDCSSFAFGDSIGDKLFVIDKPSSNYIMYMYERSDENWSAPRIVETIGGMRPLRFTTLPIKDTTYTRLAYTTIDSPLVQVKTQTSSHESYDHSSSLNIDVSGGVSTFELVPTFHEDDLAVVFVDCAPSQPCSVNLSVRLNYTVFQYMLYLANQENSNIIGRPSSVIVGNTIHIAFVHDSTGLILIRGTLENSMQDLCPGQTTTMDVSTTSADAPTSTSTYTFDSTPQLSTVASSTPRIVSAEVTSILGGSVDGTTMEVDVRSSSTVDDRVSGVVLGAILGSAVVCVIAVLIGALVLLLRSRRRRRSTAENRGGSGAASVARRGASSSSQGSAASPRSRRLSRRSVRRLSGRPLESTRMTVVGNNVYGNVVAMPTVSTYDVVGPMSSTTNTYDRVPMSNAYDFVAQTRVNQYDAVDAPL